MKRPLLQSPVLSKPVTLAHGIRGLGGSVSSGAVDRPGQHNITLSKKRKRKDKQPIGLQRQKLICKFRRPYVLKNVFLLVVVVRAHFG